MLDDRSKMPVNKKGFIKTKQFCDTFLICCLHIKVTFLKILSQSIKFPWSYSFLKYPLWANIISREKEAIKKIPSLRKQSPPTNTSQESLPIRASIRLLQFDFWVLFLFSNNLTFRLSSHICLGSIVKSPFLLKLWKWKSDDKCIHAWSKTKPAGRRESSAASTGPTSIDIERGWYNLTAMSSR